MGNSTLIKNDDIVIVSPCRGVARGGFQGFWNPPFGL